MSDFDKTPRPQDDFFGYVNNDWLIKNPIPPNESSWGTFHVLRDQSANAVKKIVAELNDTPDNELAHDQKLIRNFFATAMSFTSFAGNNLTTLDNELQKIQKIKDKKHLASYLGHAHRYDFASFWSDYVAQDDKNSQIQVLRVNQGGLCMPNRDYYLDKSSRMKQIRKEYKNYFEKVHKLQPKLTLRAWDAIYNIEKQLAKASWTDVELRDVEKNYNRFTIQELYSRFPRFDWLQYFKGLGWKSPTDNIVINQPSFIDSVLNIIDRHSLDEIKAYLSWLVLDHLLEWVDDESAKAYFDFYGQVITGKKAINPTWKRAVLQADKLIIGEVLGREYAKRYFPESSKKSVLKIVEDIRRAYHARIDKVPWMQSSTKNLAHKKLDKTKVLIGYPSKWHNLGKLEFCSDNHLFNTLAAHSFLTNIALKKIGKKPPVEDWQMNAHTVNAYYEPNQLVICFPAAILQPPFYDPSANYATNLGGIGSVIGHEFTHGFDDQGAEFDDQGNVIKWQTRTERSAFKKLANTLAKQADTYEVLPGVFLKGKLILGEIIADIGGVQLAIEALSAMDNPKKSKDNLRDLFTSYAVTERGAQREEYLLQMAKTDPHPPSRFRVNCTLQHIDDYYDAFDVSQNDKLYLDAEKRVRIW